MEGKITHEVHVWLSNKKIKSRNKYYIEASQLELHLQPNIMQQFFIYKENRQIKQVISWVATRNEKKKQKMKWNFLIHY